jgi:hypothetical protein
LASRFWVGGTGTWDASTTTNWSATTGGAGGQSVPGSADTVTFDGASGGGTVTVNTTVNVTSITMGAFTGTLDFSAHNNNVTVQSFSGTGTGARTLNMGNGTWTVTGGGGWNCLTVTSFTFNANGSTLIFSRNSLTSASNFMGALTYNTVTVAANASYGQTSFSSFTVGTLNIVAPNYVAFPSGATVTVTTLSFTGSSSAQSLVVAGTNGTKASISQASGTPTLSWLALREINFTGGATFTATQSFDLGDNAGVTITAPSSGGSVGVIGS